MIKISNMNHVTQKRKIDLSLSNVNIVTFAAAAIFLPYILSAIILCFLAIYITANRNLRKLIYIHKGASLLKSIYFYILFIPMIYQNWIGLLVGAGIIFAINFGLFCRSVMTKEIYEKLLHMICILSITSAGYAIIEQSINFMSDQRHNHRIASVFSHPNYFGTVVGIVIIICAYKVLTNQGNRWFYILTAGINVISIYLCKSMFVWMEVFLGVAILLYLLNKNKLLALWLSTAVLGLILIFALNFHFIPRLTDADTTMRIRQHIWIQAIKQIKATPLFGHGFMSFHFLFDSTYLNRLIPHSHNIYLDMLLNFGIVGSGMMIWYLVKYYITGLIRKMNEKKSKITFLILAISVSALAHGLADLTMLWIQTFPLYLIILSGLGVEEKACSS